MLDPKGECWVFESRLINITKQIIPVVKERSMVMSKKLMETIVEAMNKDEKFSVNFKTGKIRSLKKYVPKRG